jgi:hypothetical protein
MDNNTSKDSGDMGIVFNTPVVPTPEKESAPQTGKGATTQIPSQSKIPSQKDSNFSNQGQVFDVTKVFSSKHGGDGTVISDRRHRRRSLRQNVQSAFSEWWYTTQRSIDRAVNAVPSVTKLKQEEPTVSDVSSRTEVIKEAASNTLIAPQDDHQTVLKQFHTLKSDVDRLTGVPDIAIKEPTTKSTPISAWVHTVTDAPTPKVKIPTPDVRTSMIAPVVSQTTNATGQSFASVPTLVQKKQEPTLPKGATSKPVVSQVVSPKTTVGLKPIAPETEKLVSDSGGVAIPHKEETVVTGVVTTLADTKTQTLPPVPSVYAFSGLRATPLSKATEKEEVASWAHLIDDVPEMTHLTPVTPSQAEVTNVQVSKDQVIPKPKTTPMPAPQKSNITVDTVTKTAPSAISVPKTTPKQRIETSAPAIVSQNQHNPVTNIAPTYTQTPFRSNRDTQHPTETSGWTFTTDEPTKTVAPLQRTVPHELSQSKVASLEQTQPIKESSVPVRVPLASRGTVGNTPVSQAQHSAFVSTRSRETASEDISVPEPSVSAESTTQKAISSDVRRPSFSAQRTVHTQSVKQGAVAMQDQEISSPRGKNFFSQISMSYIIGGGVAAVTIVLFILGSVIFFSSSEPNDSTLSLVPSFFEVSSTVSIPLTEERGTFFTTVHDRITHDSSRNVQVSPTFIENKKERSVTSKEFFSKLGLSAPHSLISTLDETFMLGGITTTKHEPYLIIRSYNFETLFSGLLAWEDSMQSDFTPLFGIPGIENSIFRDAVSNNKSTRILYDGGGNEVLLYSFINRNTVVITTSGEALAALIKEF